MLCWPFFADQPTNCRYIYNEWEIGIEIDTNVKREEVEKLVNDLMVGGCVCVFVCLWCCVCVCVCRCVDELG